MDIENILAEEASALANEEESMKKNLEEFRKMKRSSNKASWLECLTLVAPTVEERREWATTIEKDAIAQKSVKRVALSNNFVNGPSKAPAVTLARLLVKASLKSGVQLPKSMLVDLEKSGLPGKYAEFCASGEA